jgi:hypothetical protein
MLFYLGSFIPNLLNTVGFRLFHAKICYEKGKTTFIASIKQFKNERPSIVLKSKEEFIFSI